MMDGYVVKGSKRNLNWLIVSAFRYCINRHTTRALNGIDEIILDNLSVVNDVFIKQFIDGIEHEQEMERYSRAHQKRDQFVEDTSYLTPLLNKLRQELVERGVNRGAGQI